MTSVGMNLLILVVVDAYDSAHLACVQCLTVLVFYDLWCYVFHSVPGSGDVDNDRQESSGVAASTTVEARPTGGSHSLQTEDCALGKSHVRR